MLPTPLNESPLTTSGASPLGGEPLTLTTYAMRWLHQLWVPQKNSSGDGGGSKVRSSQCGKTAPGGHPSAAVPCLILRKLFNVSSSSSSWGAGSHHNSVAQADSQGPPQLAGEGTGGR